MGAATRPDHHARSFGAPGQWHCRGARAPRRTGHIGSGLQWRQSPAYTDDILGAGFGANYGWAEIIGPHGFFPGSDFLLGMLMLGPNRHYPDHYHPAPELYWPLTSDSRWSADGQPFDVKPQGAIIWHPAMILHATITRDSPLLALWCWTSDTATPARLKAA